MKLSRSVHLQLTSRCPLQCHQCLRTMIADINGKPIPVIDMDYDVVKTIIHSGRYDTIMFCGNDGDPIYHPKFLDIISMCEDAGVYYSIHTNGSGKKPSWYKKLYTIMSDKGQIIFGIDGLHDTSKLYRVNQKFTDSMYGLILGKLMNKNVRWQVIIFNTNEHQIEKIKSLSASAKIDLDIIKTGRWFNNDPLFPKNSNNVAKNYYERIIEEKL